MEVHHHSDHKHEKKNLKSYFWEFIMLFLAVFCASLAEYELEHKIEIDRERVYMQSMVEDLRNDTIEINFKINTIDSSLVPVFDNSLQLLYLGDFSDSTVIKMYQNVPRSARFLKIYFENRTLTQLKNSGNLRLIRNKEVRDSLASYWKLCDEITNTIMTSYAETRSNTKELVYSLFNMGDYQDLSPFSPLKKNVQPKLIANDRNQCIILANHIANLASQAKGPITGSLVNANSKAINLIRLIEKEYHFK